MKGKRIIAGFLISLATCFCTLGLAACEGLTVTPNSEGGFNVTPTQSASTGSSSASSLEETSESSEEESSSSSDGDESSESGGENSSSAENDDSSVEAHEHEWTKNVVVAATCTTAGTAVLECACGEDKVKTLEALQHDCVQVAAREATCEAIGWEAYERCQRDGCNYTTYVEIEATGHDFDGGTVTKAATCTEDGVKTFTCYCRKSYTETIEKLGHSYGAWTESVAPTCEANGEEKRVCAHNAAHVETRTVEKLGHSYGDWTEASAATCAKEGVEERICANNSSHKETRSTPKTDDHTVLQDGTCSVCRQTIKNRLTTPVVKSRSDTNVTWDIVPNTAYYLVYVLPADEYVDVNAPTISLVEYFAGNKQLEIYVQAVAAEDGDYVNSEWSAVYTYEIQGVTTVGVKGVGDAVNLLTGGYTEYADGTTSIFDETLFNRLRLTEDTSVKGQTTTVTYQEGLESYLSKLTTSYNSKINYSASAGMDKVAKVTAGYNFSVEKDYAKKNFSETTAIFYDMNYYRVNKKLSLDGYNDTAKLSSILSAEFLADATKVNNGAMSAEAFIRKYGTHIVTSGIYGATFNAHYELLTSKTEAEATFGTDIQYGVSSQLGASMYGIDVGVETSASVETKYEYFTNTANSNRQTSFSINAIGGEAVGVNGVSLEAFSSACGAWAESLTDENCVLIDVPDNSLFFVWDYLGDEYTAAKNALNEYFYDTCDESYYALKDKIGSIYRESMLFDEERGILTVDFSGLNTYESADLSGIAYDDWYDNGIFTVFAAYDEKPIEKVVFKGSYYKKDNLGRTIKTKFSNFAIKFDAGWDTDILLEFDGFAYTAPAGYAALDFSATASENITAKITGAVYIQGGDGALEGANGCTGILAEDNNITLTGTGSLEVYGGNGVNATTAGGNGFDGGKAIVVGNVTVDINGELTVTGGSGGAGGNGNNGAPGSGNDAPGSNGGNGGNGGNGASAIECVSITVSESSAVSLIAGKGGNGGDGGRGGDGSDDDAPASARKGKGGNGGNGGNGGSYANPIATSNSIIPSEITCVEGTFGSGGRGGNGGDGGDSKGWFGGVGADGGAGGIGGLSGDGITRAENGNSGQTGA